MFKDRKKDKINALFQEAKHVDGFTLIELLVVVGLTVVLAGVSMPVYSNWGFATDLNEAENKVISMIRLAREMALAGYQNSNFGIHFDGQKCILYQGNSYNQNNDNRVVDIGSGLLMETDLNENDINFSQDGQPDHVGIIKIKNSFSEERVINVNVFGLPLN